MTNIITFIFFGFFIILYPNNIRYYHFIEDDNYEVLSYKIHNYSIDNEEALFIYINHGSGNVVCSFVVIGEIYQIVMSKDWQSHLKHSADIEIIYASLVININNEPDYEYIGDSSPIVGLKMGDKTFLEYDEGKRNFS